MDLRLGSGENPALLSANLLNLFDTFVILVFVPIFDACIYPTWEKCTGRPLRPIAKMQAGFIFCVRRRRCRRRFSLTTTQKEINKIPLRYSLWSAQPWWKFGGNELRVLRTLDQTVMMCLFR